jgi:hypothetical protein
MRSFALAVAVTLLLAGCSTTPGEVVAETASNLEELRSGLLELRVSATSAPGDDGPAEAGFELLGSFQLPDEDELPVADLQYSQLGLDEPVTQGFISTGESVFVEVDGQAYELAPEQTETLLGGGGGDTPLFGDASVEDWIRDPELHEGEGLDGVKVDRVTGELDVVAALNDLFTIAQRFGGATSFEPIEGDDAEQLENAVTSSTIEIISGSEDRLLRRLLIEVEMGIEESRGLSDILGPLAGVTLLLDLSISEPNEPIEVEEPADPLPIDELPPAA